MKKNILEALPSTLPSMPLGLVTSCFLSAASAMTQEADGRSREQVISALQQATSRPFPASPPESPRLRSTLQGNRISMCFAPAAYDRVELAEVETAAISQRQPDWIYFGTLHQVSKSARQLTKRLIDGNQGTRRFYDINLRSDNHTPDLVEELSGRATVAKLNEQEAIVMARWFDLPDCATERFCRRAASRFGWKAVAITRGAEGCVVLVGDDCCEAPGIPVEIADTVGAGDAFAAAFLHGLDAGWRVRRIAAFANQIGAFVTSRPGATPDGTLDKIQPDGVE